MRYLKFQSVLVAASLVLALSCYAFAGHGSNGSHGSHGSYGSYGSASYHHGSHGSYGSHGAYGGYGSHGSTGSAQYSYRSTPSYPYRSYASVLAARSDSTTLVVTVPADARITMNGRETTSTGSQRRFVSRGLESGKMYQYEIHAQVDRNGEILEKTKLVRVQAGKVSTVAFDFRAESTQQASQSEVTCTTLTVHVPDDAKVSLADNDTSLTGPVRVFTTTQLQTDQQWNDYVVRVTMHHDGQTTSREKSITLVGGKSVDVTFDFETTQLAGTPATP